MTTAHRLPNRLRTYFDRNVQRALTVDEKLIQFVDHARDKGMDHATIRRLLLSAGWKDQEVAAVICTRDLELPIPKPPPPTARPTRNKRGSSSVWPRRARDALFHLLTYGALFTCVTSLILLFFTYLDFALPDPAWKFSQARIDETFSIVRAQLSILMVAFPIFLILWHYLLQEVRQDFEKAKGGIRRWLGYLAVFVGALTLSGDVMTLVYLMLEGQWTVRLLVKTAVLFIIAGSLVLYIANTLRSEKEAEQ